MVKRGRFRACSRRGSRVRIPSPAYICLFSATPFINKNQESSDYKYSKTIILYWLEGICEKVLKMSTNQMAVTKLLNENDNQYAGEWVAIYKNKVFAHNKSLKKLNQTIKEIPPQETVLILKVPEKDAIMVM